MRLYQPIWLKLLSSPSRELKVRCLEKDHPKILQAVYKEKAKDLEGRKKWNLETKKVKEDVLLFRLVKKPNIFNV